MPTQRKSDASTQARGGVVLFDTYSMVFRAFHALPPMTTSRGEPTGALYGASALVLKVLREHQPRAFAFAADAPKRTFRHELYAEYKAQREAAPADLVAQLRRLPDWLAAFGVPVWCAPGYEADDVLATLARRLVEDQPREPVLIVSGDRDLLQLVNERVRVWFIGARGKPATLFDMAAIRERFGVLPEQLPAWTALVGDNADNLIGAPGIGPKTATQLVTDYGNIAAIVGNVAELKPRKVQDSIGTHAERLLLNEELARLRRDVPLDVGPEAQALTSSNVTRLSELFAALEFRSLIPRVAGLMNVP